MRKINILLVTIGVLMLSSMSSVFARQCPVWLPSMMCDQAGNLLLDPNSIVRLALYLIIVAAILWTLWNIIQAGFNWAASGGDEERRGKATKQIISALVGLLIVVVSFTIMSLVVNWLGGARQELKLGVPCFTEKGEAGIWLPENDTNKNGEIDKNECQAIK